MTLSVEVLRESPAARNLELDRISSRIVKLILEDVKLIIFSNWTGIDFITVPQMAEIFKAETKQIRNLIRGRHYEEEFTRDGVKCLTDFEAIQANYALGVGKNRSKLIICPPKSILRLAMITSEYNNMALEITRYFVEYINKKERSNLDNDSDLKQQITTLTQIVVSSQDQWSKTNQALTQITSSLAASPQNSVGEEATYSEKADFDFQATELGDWQFAPSKNCGVL